MCLKIYEEIILNRLNSQVIRYSPTSSGQRSSYLFDVLRLNLTINYIIYFFFLYLQVIKAFLLLVLSKPLDHRHLRFLSSLNLVKNFRLSSNKKTSYYLPQYCFFKRQYEIIIFFFFVKFSVHSYFVKTVGNFFRAIFKLARNMLTVY